MALGSRCSCKSILKKRLGLLPVPCEYIFLLMMFTLNDLDHFHTNSDVHGTNTRAKHQMHRTTVNLSCIKESLLYSSIKIYNNLPPYIFKLKKEKQNFKIA